MAKKKQNQPTSTTETNLTPKGMIKDSDASYMSKQNWNHARNAINNSIDGDVGVIGNEPANLECVTIPYTIIGGIHLYGDVWAIFSTDNINSEIGRFDDSRCEYETIVNDGCLNFSTDHLITGVSKENYDCQWVVYWDDALNPSRVLNIDDIPYIPDPSCTDPCDPCYTTNLDCDAIRLAPYMDVPCITLSKAEEGGSLVNGTYQVFIAYTLDNQVIGDYVGISNLQSLWNHSGPSGSLDINISNLDKDFDTFQLVVRFKTHNAISTRIVGYYSTEQTTINLDYIDGRLEVLTDLALVVRNPVYEKSDGMYVVNDYLIRSQPTEKFDFNYQPLANLIHTHWESWRYPSTYYSNGGNKPSFMRDEQYAFFIRWIYNTGDKSKAYHIPGRAPHAVADWQPGYTPGLMSNDDLNVTGLTIAPSGSSEPYFKGVNTANYFNAADIGEIKDPKAGGVKVGEGHMGYWESTELYPHDPVRWNSSHHTWSNFGNTDNDLCGQPIRHHKFPDETLVAQGTDATLLSPTVNGVTGEFINILGVKFENIYPPVDNDGVLIPGIVGYEILTGSRSGNKSILAKGIIRNMFTYERDTTTAGYNTGSGPRQGGSSWGVFPNYPYNDLHSDPYLLNRNRGQLISNRPWYDGIEDNFLVDPSQHASQDTRGLGEITRDYFTFHSPDTMFSRMFLNPSEIKLYKTVRGKQLGNFKRSEEHPRFKLIKKRAVFVAAIIGVGYAINQMRGPEDLSITGAGQNPAGMSDVKALGSGTALSPFPVVGNGLSAANSVFHLIGMGLTYIAKGALDLVLDGATVLGMGRDAKQIAIPAFNAAESGATGLTGAASGSEKTITMRGTDFTGVPRIMAMITGIFAFLNYVATGGDKILDLIRNLVSYQDHVYKYISHGFYNEEVILPPLTWSSVDVADGIMDPFGMNDTAWRRNVEDARYIKQAFSAFPGNVMINNLRRQSTVVLSTQDLTGNGSTGPGGTVTDGTYGGLLDPNGNDFSKFTIGDGMCNDCQNPNSGGTGATVTWYSPGVQTCKPIAANYAALKVNIDNQYGQIDNILMQPAGGDCNMIDPNNLVAGQTITDNGGYSQVHWGGDVYINRYTEKTSMPFFWDFLKDGEPDGIAWDYKNYPNVPYPRYWLDSNKFRMDEYIKPITDLSFDWTGHTPGDLYHLDGPTAVTCEGGSATFTGADNYDPNDSPTSGITASYDTTDELLIATISTNSTPGAGGPGLYTPHVVETVNTWANGAWELPEDGSGVDCTCNDCWDTDPITGTCFNGSNPCGPTCIQPDSTLPPLNNGNLFDNFANANAVYTGPLNGVSWQDSYITFQATTCNDQAKAWTQQGAVVGTGGQANGTMPNVTDANGDPIYRWHQNYSVLRLNATVNINVNIKSADQNIVDFNGVTDVYTITHPDDPTDVRDVQGVVSGEYKRGTLLTAGGANLTGPLTDKTYFEINGLGGQPDRSYSNNQVLAGCNPQDFGASIGYGGSAGTEEPGYVNQTVQLEARVYGLAAVYNWNTGGFEYVVDDRYSWLQAPGNITPNPIPSGGPTTNANELLPKENFDTVTIVHGNLVRPVSCGGGWPPPGNSNTHVIEGGTQANKGGLFSYIGGDGTTTGYQGQNRADFHISVQGGTPIPSSFNNVNYENPEPPYEAATDTDNSGGVFVVTEHYMYTHNNGVQDFFVESEVNVAYRDYSDSITTRHYDYLDYTDINTMFDAKIQDVDNYYKYDKSLNVKRFWNTSFGEIQPRWYDPYVSETCLTKFPKRLIYSLPTGGVTLKKLKQQKKEANKDFWRIFLSKNFRDFKSTVNTIKPINKTGAIVLFPTISPQMFQGVDALNMDKGGTKLIIGDGGLFSQAFQNVANSDLSHEYGSCESARSVVNTPMGLFYVSQAQGKIFQYGSKGISAISDNGMKWWFNKYLPSRLIAALPSVEDCPTIADNPVTGIGVQTVYDPMNDIIYFSKRDYDVTSDCVCFDDCNQGFYVDNDCLAGSGSGCGENIATGICNHPNAVYNPVTMLCEHYADCDPTPNVDCPAGYQSTMANNSCSCCADDSTSGYGDGDAYPAGLNYGSQGQKACFYQYTPSSIIAPNTSPIELGDPNFFEDASWTVSYDPKSKAWISFHDWHPELTFNSINHFLTTKEGIPSCPPGYTWDPIEEECCEDIEITVPRLTNINIMQMTPASGVGTPNCIDAITTNGTPCPTGFDLVLPCSQNVFDNHHYSICGESNCSCVNNGSNQSLQSFRNTCETTMGQYTSWDDGTPCPTAQEIFDYEYTSDGSPNGLTYVDPGFCNARCRKCRGAQQGTSIWRHNTRTDLYANFYGVDYPWEVDLIEHSGQSVATIRSLEYQLESYIYQNESKDRFHDLDWNFDEAIIYNTEQVSGLLRLNITPKNNPVLASTFPIVGPNFIDILYSKEEQKYRFNQFWDITNDRGEFSAAQQAIFNTQWNGYIRNLNAANLNYNKAQTQRKKFRHYYNHILLRRVRSENRKMLLRLNNTKLNISMR